MPNWFLAIVVFLLMFIAGPSIPAIFFNMAAQPQYEVFVGLPSVMRATGIIFWIADWGALVAIIVYAIKKAI